MPSDNIKTDGRSPSVSIRKQGDAEVSAWIGTAITLNSETELGWLLRPPQIAEFVENNAARLSFTFAGWQRYENIKHAQVVSRTAFMAMQFADAKLDRIVNDYFRPAVANRL